MSSADTEDVRDDEKLRKAERLRERGEFLATQRNGERASSRRFVVYARQTDRSHSRIGLTVSTKVGNAVVRNWWKRRLREIFRRNKREYPPGFDFVVIVKASAEQAELEILEQELLDVLNRVAESPPDE